MNLVEIRPYCFMPMKDFHDQSTDYCRNDRSQVRTIISGSRKDQVCNTCMLLHVHTQSLIIIHKQVLTPSLTLKYCKSLWLINCANKKLAPPVDCCLNLWSVIGAVLVINCAKASLTYDNITDWKWRFLKVLCILSWLEVLCLYSKETPLMHCFS